MANVPMNQMPLMAQVPQNQRSQVPPNQTPLISQRPPNQMRLGPNPCTVTCASCGASIVTTVTMQPSAQTHLAALILCCLCICLACVPYCMDSCQNADHHCPNCDAYLGSYKR